MAIREAEARRMSTLEAEIRRGRRTCLLMIGSEIRTMPDIIIWKELRTCTSAITHPKWMEAHCVNMSPTPEFKVKKKHVTRVKLVIALDENISL